MPIWGGAPNVERLKAKRDLTGLIKAMRYKEDDVVRANAIAAAIEVVVYEADMFEESEVVSRRIESLVSALVTEATHGDRLATDTLIRIMAGAFKGKGVASYENELARLAEEALEALGSSVVISPLLQILQEPDDYARMRAVTVLGRIGDLAALRPIVTLGIATDPETPWSEAPWARDLRQACFVAGMNIFVAEPDGYDQAMGEASPEEREFMQAMKNYVESGIGRR